MLARAGQQLNEYSFPSQSTIFLYVEINRIQKMKSAENVILMLWLLLCCDVATKKSTNTMALKCVACLVLRVNWQKRTSTMVE